MDPIVQVSAWWMNTDNVIPLRHFIRATDEPARQLDKPELDWPCPEVTSISCTSHSPLGNLPLNLLWLSHNPHCSFQRWVRCQLWLFWQILFLESRWLVYPEYSPFFFFARSRLARREWKNIFLNWFALLLLWGRSSYLTFPTLSHSCHQLPFPRTQNICSVSLPSAYGNVQLVHPQSPGLA